MNLCIINNFLPYPNVVRAWALSHKFYNAKEFAELTNEPNTWPGYRTEVLPNLDTAYADVVLSRISYLALTNFGIQHDHIRSCFQICLKDDGDSWIHTDHDVDLAGILYLTPNPPADSGTTIYSNPPHETLDSIGNVYNRLVLYRSNLFHKSQKYFGDTLETGRLTQVFFIKGK